jgi:L-lactate dehydrogenase complex protein LldF
MRAAASATTAEFRRRAAVALEDVRLQGALEGATGRFRSAREVALADLPDADALRDHFKAARAATLAELGRHLQTFERQAMAAGARVHWAQDASAACQIVASIAHSHGATLAAKTKSMATEEIGLNGALRAAGVEPVETDLGEWIIQLAGEPPFHIVAPAIHQTRGQVAELLGRQAGRTLPADDIPLLTAEARRMLREKFRPPAWASPGPTSAWPRPGASSWLPMRATPR